LMAEMPESYRDILERIDIGGSSIHEVATDLTQSENNITVKLHRARKDLRKRVEACCQVSNATACLDCSCEI
jgi:RNA polymerase sigma-70 factor (ECF subfamily)